jgi:hypothetical protein
MNNNLYAIVPYFNFFKNKYRELNLKAFLISYKEIPNLKIYIVEGVCTDAEYNNPLPPEITKLAYKHVVYDVPQTIFIKENLINLAVKNHLPTNWENFCWIDGDIIYDSNNWVDNVLNELKTHDIVQMFSIGFQQASENTKYYKAEYGLICFAKLENKNPIFEYIVSPHPGYAWAMTRNLYEQIDGLWEFNIIGGADSIIGTSAIMWKNLKEIDVSILDINIQYNNTNIDKMLSRFYYSEDFRKELYKYVYKFKGCRYSYLSNHIFHLYHGDLGKRHYGDRHDSLKAFEYKKSFINYTGDGVMYLNNTELLHNIKEYINNKETI